MRASLVDGDDSRIAPLLAAGRVEVYRNTFASALVNALRLSHPAVHKLVGADFFEAAARMFIADRPPASACLDEYGGGFSGFLAGFEPASSLPYLPDVARLEWAVCRALHAPDADVLGPERLTGIGDRTFLVPHPSISLLAVRRPADLIWRAVLAGDDAALSAIDPASGPGKLLVERREGGVEVTRLPEPEWRFAERLCAGRPLLAVLGEDWDFDVAQALAGHLAAGRFVSIEEDA